jgi:hypothetical protein
LLENSDARACWEERHPALRAFRQPGKTALRFDPFGLVAAVLVDSAFPITNDQHPGRAERPCDLRSDRREAPRSAPFLTIQRADSRLLAARDAVPPCAPGDRGLDRRRLLSVPFQCEAGSWLERGGASRSVRPIRGVRITRDRASAPTWAVDCTDYATRGRQGSSGGQLPGTRSGGAERARDRVQRSAWCYGSTAVMFLFGTWPTGICISSLRVATSITLTEFDPALAT